MPHEERVQVLANEKEEPLSRSASSPIHDATAACGARVETTIFRVKRTKIVLAFQHAYSA